MSYLFVGLRPSPTARREEWGQAEQRLRRATLTAALTACGLTADTYHCLDLFDAWTGAVVWYELEVIPARRDRGERVVALGPAAHGVLREAAIPFLPMHHPPARGSVSHLARYQAHVAAVLAPCRTRAAPARHDTDPGARGQRRARPGGGRLLSGARALEPAACRGLRG